jgi:hypothetical protein
MPGFHIHVFLLVYYTTSAWFALTRQNIPATYPTSVDVEDRICRQCGIL